MKRDLRQPVLVGIGACMQREDDFSRAREPMDLMLEAVRRAGADAGAPGMLEGLECIAVPKGRWRYRNPAGEIARTVGAQGATTVLATVGVLQQTLIGDACREIAAGRIDSALIAGADTGWRILRARAAGARAGERQQEDSPHRLMEAEEELLHPAEMQAGIRMPVALYAILESAWRAERGWTPDAHRQRLGAMYQRFSEIASSNPHAWRRAVSSADEISIASERNPMQAFPYTRLHCAAWNVDQAAALILCSTGKAEALGIPRKQWVHAWASTEANHMVPVSARKDLSGCAGARLAGRSALAAGGIDASQLDLIELYSCFPIAVETFAEELGVSLERDLTVTGGMAFAGGPFNNYVLQATCRMAELIREGRGRTGLVSSVSGVLTKQGFGLWGGESAPHGFVLDDLTAEVRRQTETVEVAETFRGRAKVSGYTVLHEKGGAPRALVLADTEPGGRALAGSEDAGLVRRMESQEMHGADIMLDAGTFRLA